MKFLINEIFNEINSNKSVSISVKKASQKVICKSQRNFIQISDSICLQRKTDSLQSNVVEGERIQRAQVGEGHSAHQGRFRSGRKLDIQLEDIQWTSR